MDQSALRSARLGGRSAGSPEPRSIGPNSPRDTRILFGIVAAVLVLNLFDALFTALWVYGGMAREANPLMATLLDRHPLLFVMAKLGLVGLGSHLLWRRRHEPLAVVAIFTAFVAYYAVLVLHLDALSRVLGHLWARG